MTKIMRAKSRPTGTFQIFFSAMTVALVTYAGTTYASPYQIPGLTIDAKQTYYDNSNGTLAPKISLASLPAGTTQLVFAFSGGVITDGSNQLASADGLYSNGQTPYNFSCTNYGASTYMGVKIGCTTGIDPAVFGVFFDPNFSGTPADSLNFRSDSGISQDPRTLDSYSPSVNQPFWIGDGYTGNDVYGAAVSGTQQVFNIPTVPAGDSLYLLLGIGADINMADNQNSLGQGGSFSGGGSAPEPGTFALLTLGLAGVVVSRRRRY